MTFVLPLFAAVLLGIALSSRAAEEAKPKAQPPNRVQWEHLALTHNPAQDPGTLARKINELGRQGWELVTVNEIAGANGHLQRKTFYFKRPL